MNIMSVSNLQANHNSNKNNKKSFGMKFPEHISQDIAKSKNYISLEMAQTLQKWRDSPDEFTLNTFRIEEDNNGKVLFSIDILDKHRVNVYSIDHKKMPQNRVQKIIDSIFTDSFLEKVASKDKEHAKWAEECTIKRKEEKIKEAQREAILNDLTGATSEEEDNLVNAVIGDFAQLSGIPEDQSRRRVVHLIRAGVDTPEKIKDTAKIINQPSDDVILLQAIQHAAEKAGLKS